MSEEQNNWNGKTGSFIKRPGKGWLHPDETLESSEVVYNIKYIGMIPVNEPMKSLSFEMRTLVARESIRRVAETAQSTIFQRKNRKNDETLSRILSSKPELQYSGTDVVLHINIQILKVHRYGIEDLLFQHNMQNISFACGGDADIQDYVAYVAKDEQKRACYVFQCQNNLANNVITTIGQAFELRFKKFIGTLPTGNGITSNNGSNENRNGQPPTPPPTTKIPTTNDNTFIRQLSNDPSQTNGKSSLSHTSSIHGIDENLHKMIWFHGNLQREEAERLLKTNGDFLVRVSVKAEKQYVLSGRYQNECRHIILIDPSGTVRTKDRTFKNICELIEFHQTNNVPITSRDNELVLQNPVPRN